MTQNPKYLRYLTIQINPAQKINITYIFQNHHSSMPIMNIAYVSDEVAC